MPNQTMGMCPICRSPLPPSEDMRCPGCGSLHEPEQRLVSVDQLMKTKDRITALEGALREAVGIVGGGRNPESTRNRKATEWVRLLEEQ